MNKWWLQVHCLVWKQREASAYIPQQNAHPSNNLQLVKQIQSHVFSSVFFTSGSYAAKICAAFSEITGKLFSYLQNAAHTLAVTVLQPPHCRDEVRVGGQGDNKKLGWNACISICQPTYAQSVTEGTLWPLVFSQWGKIHSKVTQ